MDRTILFACLALLIVVQVQSYTLQDVLRNRLRQRELSRLREYDMHAYDANPVYDDREQELSRLREYNMYDTNPVYDDREQALNLLRKFHFKRMFDDGKKQPDCVDNRNDCHGAKLNGLCDELDYPPEHQHKHTVDFITLWCRKTCNVNNCNGAAGEIKPTKAPFPGKPEHCADNQELALKCKGWGTRGFCKPEYGDIHYLQNYMYQYCSATCAGIVGAATVGCKF